MNNLEEILHYYLKDHPHLRDFQEKDLISNLYRIQFKKKKMNRLI